MRDLVEKVETAIEYQIQNHGFGPHVPRAAIAAVLEHYSHEANAPTHNKDRDWSWAFAQNFALAMQDELERVRA